MQYLILGLVALALLLMASKFIVQAQPATLARYSRNIGGVLSLIFAAFLAARGAIAYAGPLALFGIGLLNGGFSFGKTQKTEGQRSKVRTDFLEMELDHDSGAMRGQVLAGKFSGQFLNDLDLEALLELRAECHAGDPQSAQLLDAYLDRTEEDWREKAGLGGAGDDAAHGAHAGAPPGESAMTRDEAYEILGLKPGASADDIHAAHRTLMKKNHPDQGGSTYLAAKINEAKDLLLG